MSIPTNSRRLSALVLSCASSICFVSGFAVTAGNGAAFLAHSPLSTEFSTTALSMAQRRGRPRGPLRTIEVKPPMNDEIKYDELRVVTPNPKGKDEPLGIMSKSDALAKAKELGGLDLILINENSDPPVCKIVDYSKYRYMKEKKAKEQKKNSKATEVKEVKMSYKIDVHDYGVRLKAASKFINQGNRVKCTVMFKGREVTHENLGVELLGKLADDMTKICLMEGKPKREGRNLSVIMTPRPEIVKSINEKKRAEEKAVRRKKEKSLKKLQERQAAAAAAAAGVAGGAAVADVNGMEGSEGGGSVSLDDLLTADDDDGDSDGDMNASLDELLGGDDLTDDLFS